ncbi:MAG TPA: methionyl-tRNA formyltransferase [Bacteroidia bacterium]|jgi:methionyl-tRNA formyltransferase|nr:methionyl-tRNA formyltransferase [Bacteroidia bacterium]
MRIVFMGTPEFAVPSLEILIKNHYNIVGVVTVPDKPAGRGQQLQESAIKKFAVENGLKVLRPLKLKDPEFIAELRSLNADLQIVVAFRMLPDEVWNMPRLGTYNLHGSLLPKYRGAAPINWAIINGETETGVTTFKLKHEIDTGSILYQQKVSITENSTAGDLHDDLMKVGASLILETVRAIESGKAELKVQDDTQAIHAPKIFKETCKINWSQSPKQIYNLVRGLSPYPAAFTEFTDLQGSLMSLKIISSLKEDSLHTHANGFVATDNKTYLKVACKGGYISIKELQLQGKKKMSTEEFLRGYKFPDSTILL